MKYLKLLLYVFPALLRILIYPIGAISWTFMGICCCPVLLLYNDIKYEFKQLFGAFILIHDTMFLWFLESFESMKEVFQK